MYSQVNVNIRQYEAKVNDRGAYLVLFQMDESVAIRVFIILVAQKIGMTIGASVQN